MQALRVGVITDDIDDGNAGLASYARGLVAGFECLATDQELTLVHSKDHPFYEGRRHVVVGSVDARKAATKGFANKVLRRQLLLPIALSRYGFDVVHDTYHYAPFLMPRTGFRRVVTIHDLIPLIMPAATSWQAELIHRTLVRFLVRRSDQVIVDSESTKRDVVRLYRKQAESINVVHLAADPCYRPIDDECSRTRVRERYGLPDRFLLYVGTIEPRKNLVRLIEAYKRVRRDIGNAPLVLAGGLGWKYEGILKAAADPELDESVLMPGRIPDEDLPVLYSLASAFVFPSLYEGFGLPPLEALQSGCPVVTSNSSSLPEVVGDAGIQVDPRSTEEICEALIRIMSSEDLRQDLRERGLTRARRFSWARCAAETIAVYQRAAGAFTTDVTAV